jgi:hypothetical protein
MYSEQRIGGGGLDLELRLTPRHVKEEREDKFQLGVRLRQRIKARREKTAKGFVTLSEARRLDLISTTLAIKSCLSLFCFLSISPGKAGEKCEACDVSHYVGINAVTRMDLAFYHYQFY